MKGQSGGSGSKWGAGISVSAIIVITVVAAYTRVWVLTAVPVGFLFGFFLQKGDLCGSSAFSEVLVMKDRRKLFGLWILIVTAMVAFAALQMLGWVRLAPKPFLYVNYLVGGALFGTGMVLAGGCISGCLFKAATGNLNSIAGLLTIPAGVMAVEFGPLNPLQTAMNRFVLRSADGGPVTLSTLSGLPFWVLALLFAAITVAIILVRRGKQPGTSQQAAMEPWLEKALRRPWKPWASGIAIGLLMAPAYLSSVATGRNYPLGVTHGVMQAELLVVDRNVQHVWRVNPPPPAQRAAAAPSTPVRKPVSWWLVLVSLALPLGSWVSARMNGRVRLMPKPPDEILTALAGGFLTGAGAAFATGCVVGNIMSGWALMSVGMILFGVVTILANWITSYYYLLGGQRPV
jgi:uncharacterized membrane protein YedE/YeeE